MQQDKPSRTAYKVALSMVTLAAKPGMDRILPSGIAEASEKLLVASGVNFVEIDHPATAHRKARGIESMGRRKNLRLVAEDLGKRKLSDVRKTD